MLISAVEQGDSVIYIHTPSFKIFFSIMAYLSILNMVPCAVGPCHLSFLYNNCLHLLFPNSQSTPPRPGPGNHSIILCVFESISVL